MSSITYTVALGVMISFVLATSVLAQEAVGISGVYALSGQDQSSPSAVIGNPNVDGLALRYSWDELEPNEGVFDWSKIDHEIAQARAHHKKVSLSITPGVRTPAWVYAAGSAQFKFVWDKPWGAPVCSQQKIPLPWDPVFLSKWKTFVRQLGRKYGTDPTLVCVKITGINGATQEAILPHSSNRPIARRGATCSSGDEVERWRHLGYTRSMIAKSWRTIAVTFGQSFPDKMLGVMLTAGGFPPIDASGNVMNKRADAQIVREIIDEGITMFGSRFVVQNNALSAFWSWNELANLSGRTTIGWQMLWEVTGDRGCRMNHGRKPCDPHAVLQAAVDRGLDSGARFLEIYTSDILNPQLQDVLARAHSRLRLTPVTR